MFNNVECNICVMTWASGIDSLPDAFHSRYVLREVLPSGANSIVYRARHVASDQCVALKVVRKCEEEGKNTSLRREIEILQSLSGVSHVVQLCDVMETVERVLLCFELCDVNLQRLVSRVGPVRLEVALRWTREVAEGLAAMHQLGQVHRDLKPSNLLLDSEGSIRICHFARACFESDREVGSCGSAPYAAPELSEKLCVFLHTTRADIYSLGVCFQHFTLGRAPKHVREIPSGLPTDVLRLLGDMEDSVPVRRPSAEELLAHHAMTQSMLEILLNRGMALLSGECCSPQDNSPRTRGRRLRRRSVVSVLQEDTSSFLFADY